MGFNQCTHHYSNIQYSFTVLKILWVLIIHLSLPCSPGQPVSLFFFFFFTIKPFIVFIVLSFPDYHIIELTQYVAFLVWLLSVSNMHLSFLDVFSCLNSSFLLISHVQPFVTPWTVAHQALLAMKFSRQEFWSGQPFTFPGDLPNLGIKPRFPELQADSLPSEPPGKP